ncbi:MAG: BTAD domain-containing putative transcriptional regulator [Chloroflexota bacterium]
MTHIADFDNSVEDVLKLRLLGTYEMSFGSGCLSDFGSRKAQALLFYLAMTSRSSSRDTIVALLWPEMTEKAAKNNLRSTLTTLKRHIGPYLDVTRGGVTFNRRLPLLFDVERLRIGLQTTISAKNVREIWSTLELYQGELLQGFQIRSAGPFEEWMLPQREQLRSQTLRALEMLTEVCIEQSEYSIGLAASHKQLALEPWSETAYRQLMRLLLATGQRALALRQFEICCQTLAKGLGVEPMAETVELYQYVKVGAIGSSPSWSAGMN